MTESATIRQERVPSSPLSLLDRIRGYTSQYVEEDDFDSRISQNARWVFEKKYLLRDDDGQVIETPKQAIYRVARTMAEVERKNKDDDLIVHQWAQRFYDIISSKSFCPAGRVWTNAGKEISLFNCYVLPVPDSVEGIYKAVGHAARIHKEGGGTGYNFSRIRPRGSYVKKSQGVASGPIPFIKQFDTQTAVINSGNRRGANMGILNIYHPDIFEFIYAKHEMGEITNFNVSVGVNDEFISAVESGEYYTLRWAGKEFTRENLGNNVKNIESGLAGAEVGQKPKPPSIKIADNGVDIIDTYRRKIVGRIQNGVVQLKADMVMDTIAELAWKTGDPGIVYLDEINRHNPLPKLGDIEATNPCAEQPLHPYDACNLGSINLNVMVDQEDGRPIVDKEKIIQTTKIAVRFMDNVNDASRGPIPEIEETVKKHRRIGLGVMGYADMLFKLGMPYDSEEALKVAEEVMELITDTAKQTSIEIAREKGVFPAFEQSIYNNGRPEERIRNVERTTIAPTGTISMVFDTSSGIEPWFAISYRKNIRGGASLYYFPTYFKEVAKKRGFWKEDLLERIHEAGGSIQHFEEIPADVKRTFKGSKDIDPAHHVKVQAAFQRYTDNAVSKTINLPSTATIEDVKIAYLEALKSGIKGITVYVDKSKKVQVLETGEKKEGLEKIIKKNGSDILDGVLEKAPDVSHYSIRTGDGKLHVTITYDKNGFPKEIFTTMPPIGSTWSNTINLIGLRESRYLQESQDPNLITMLRDYGTVKSDKPTGIGPKRVNSPQHGLSIILRHDWLERGILKHGGGDVLEQIVFKNQDVPVEKDMPITKSMTNKEIEGIKVESCEKCGSPNIASGLADCARGYTCSNCGYSNC